MRNCKRRLSKGHYVSFMWPINIRKLQNLPLRCPSTEGIVLLAAIAAIGIHIGAMLICLYPEQSSSFPSTSFIYNELGEHHQLADSYSQQQIASRRSGPGPYAGGNQDNKEQVVSNERGNDANKDATAGISAGSQGRPPLQRWETLSRQVQQKAGKLRWPVRSWTADKISQSGPVLVEVEVESASLHEGCVLSLHSCPTPGEDLTVPSQFRLWQAMDRNLTKSKIMITRGNGLVSERPSLTFKQYEVGEKYEAHLDSCFLADFAAGRLHSEASPEQFMSSGCEDFLKQAGGPGCGFDHAGGVTCGDRQVLVQRSQSVSPSGVAGALLYCS
eukprot:scaffold312219_cov38-Prasinocladus_malaysianus.AAC.1